MILNYSGAIQLKLLEHPPGRRYRVGRMKLPLNVVLALIVAEQFAQRNVIQHTRANLARQLQFV